MTNLVIKGGKGDLSLGYLESISEHIVRAKTAGSRVVLNVSLFQHVLHDLMHRLRQEETTGVEESFDFSDLEITDLDQLGEDSIPEAVQEEEEDFEIFAPIRRTSLVTRQRHYRLPVMSLKRVIVVSLLGFLILAALILLEG